VTENLEKFYKILGTKHVLDKKKLDKKLADTYGRSVTALTDHSHSPPGQGDLT
jgi:hypothetical protein